MFCDNAEVVTKYAEVDTTYAEVVTQYAEADTQKAEVHNSEQAFRLKLKKNTEELSLSNVQSYF
ncbi:hypothetical protein [Oceanobacillus sp. CAU 1775]